MLPILFSIGPLTFKTYGLFVALGALAGFHILKRELAHHKISETTAEHLLLISVGLGILGSRILYVATEGLPLSEFFKVWEGGLSITGGLILGGAGVFAYTRAKKLPLPVITDAMTLAAAIGHGIGRLGCLGAGCCWGLPTDSYLSITFTHPQSFVPMELLGVALHPTQIYEFLGLIFIFALLWQLRRRFSGQLLGIYLILYTLLRGALEIIRGDAIVFTTLASMTLVQAILLFGALPAGLLWIWNTKQKSSK